MRSILLMLATVCLFAAPAQSQCVTNVDFNTWSVAESPPQTNWTVYNGGANCTNPTNNGQPSFFVTPFDLINVEITGTFQVTGSSDDDWIGFVVGHQDPIGVSGVYDTWLFDWKKCWQDISAGDAPGGMSLNRVNGTITGGAIDPAFSIHQQSAQFQTIWENWGGAPTKLFGSFVSCGNGPEWNHNQQYDFRLIYSLTRLALWIDGNQYFDIPGCYQPGRFGFYGLSQPNADYSNFQYTLSIDFALNAPTICQGDTTVMTFVDTACGGGFDFSTVQSMVWDYGDGNGFTNNSPNASNVNPKHVYAAPGTYNISLILTDVNGCSDNITKPVTITPASIAGFTATDECLPTPITFINTTTDPGSVSSWDWSFGDGTSSSAQSPPGKTYTAGTYPVTLTVDNGNGCVSSVTQTVTAHSEIFPSFIVTDVSCNGGSNGAIDMSYAGSTVLSFSGYNWSNGETTEDISNIPAGSYSVTATDINGCSGTELNIVVAEPLAISLSTTVTAVTCPGITDGSVDLTATGGTAPLSYSWDNGATTEDLANITDGTYRVTVTDANNCQDTISAIVGAAPNSIVISSVKIDVTCNAANDGSIDITASGGAGGFVYNWSNGPATEDITALGPGIYTVTVTDANGCFQVNSDTITEPPAITITEATTHVTCNGASNGAIDITAAGGTGTLQYLWSTGDITEDIAGLSGGSFDLTVTDANLCQEVLTGIVINEPTLLQVASTVVDVNCNGGSDGVIDIGASGGTLPYSFLWDDGTTTEDRNNLTAGNYTITVTDNNLCQESLLVTVMEPAAAIAILSDPTQVSCNGLSDGAIDITTSGGTVPYLINWDDGAFTEDRTGITAGTYTISITDQNNCQETLTETITEPDVLELASAPTITDVSCGGLSDGAIDITIVGGTTPYGAVWSDGALTEDQSGITAGSYTVTITDANLCEYIEAVTVTEPDEIILLLIGEEPGCTGLTDGSVAADITGGAAPLTYNWNNGGTTSQITNLGAGDYELIVTDNNGCADTSTITLTDPAPIALDAGGTDSISLGEVVEIDALYSANTSSPDFSWNPPSNLSCADCPNPEASPIRTAEYVLTMTDGPCVILDTLIIIVDDEKVVYIPNAFTPNGDGVNDRYNVISPSSSRILLRIFDRWGELVYVGDNDPLGWDGFFKGKELAPDIYVYDVFFEYLDRTTERRRGSLTVLR